MKILMLAVPSGKPWNGLTLYQEPLGGSESAVAYLARSFARQGNDVTVMTHGSPTVVDGVTYLATQSLAEALTQQWDVLISSRWVDVLQYQWQAGVRLLWFHDMPSALQGHLPVQRLVCLTQFHKNAWQWSDKQCAVIGNGVDTALFKGPEVPRNKNKLIWTSNPERGLPIAAKIFQELRKRWPDLELHIYGRAAVYGWDDAFEAPYLPREEHLENVVLHEPLNKVGLAKVLRESWAWFYPSWWPETYCIAALEAQAAGTPVISVPMGGLLETVKGGVLSWDFLNSVSQLRNESKWKKESEAGREFAMGEDWDVIAERWLEVVEHAKSKPAVP